jgi:transposase
MQTAAEIIKKYPLKSTDQEMKNLIEALLQHSLKLEHKIIMFERYIYGRRSEKFIDPNQPSLGFDEVEACEEEISDEVLEESPDKSPSENKKKRRPQLQIPESIPREVITHEIPESERLCECCSKIKCEIGEEVVEKLHIIPATLLVKKHIYKKYACQNKVCEQVPVQAPREPVAIPKIKASEDLLAFIAEQKYGYGLPLYRLEKMFAADGCEISRYVMSLWMIQLSEALEPVYECMKEQLRQSSYVHMDETVVQVLKEKDRPATSDSRMWVMCSDLRSTSPPVAIYHYSPTRKAEVIHELLGPSYKGYLHSDDYAGYSSYEKDRDDVIHALCWDHARRHFWDAYQSIPKAKRSNSTSERIIKLIGKLYKVEDRIKGQPDAVVLEARTKESNVTLAKIKSLAEEKLVGLSSLSPTYKAIDYMLSNWEKLVLYTKHPRLNISNNPAEQRMRPFVIGRKAWLFSNTPRGAKASAILYSIVETAKLNGLIPGEYIRDILKALAVTSPQEILKLLAKKKCDQEKSVDETGG